MRSTPGSTFSNDLFWSVIDTRILRPSPLPVLLVAVAAEHRHRPLTKHLHLGELNEQVRVLRRRRQLQDSQEVRERRGNRERTSVLAAITHRIHQNH